MHRKCVKSDTHTSADSSDDPGSKPKIPATYSA